VDTATAAFVLLVLRAYAGVGLVLALPFALVLAPRLDTGARGSSLGFRLLLVPGATLLWPLVLGRVIARRAS
jgi:hypothetical protein